MEDDTSTLTIEGFTPYAQIPRWMLRAGGRLSHGAVRLYGVLMTYADNGSKAAFPSRETLASDLGASVATVKRAIKELEEFGALKVTRRRNKRTGNFYANLYVLVFTDPWVNSDPPRGSTDDPRTTPTNSTTPTTPTAMPVPDMETPSLRSPSPDGAGRELLGLVRAIPRAESIDERDDAAQAFLDAFEDQHGTPPGDWDHGWSERLDQLVRDHGLEYGTAKWLRIYTNTAHA